MDPSASREKGETEVFEILIGAGRKGPEDRDIIILLQLPLWINSPGNLIDQSPT